MRKHFGTDGIRGTAGVYPVVPEFMVKLGRAVPQAFRSAQHRPRVLIGKDTRLSGYMLESALTAGLTMVGAEVLLTGPLPTPALALLVRSLRCDAGLMITASHNPYGDNGVKVFNALGDKPSDDEERLLEQYLEMPEVVPYVPGIVRRASGALERYIEILKAQLPAGVRFDGLRLCVDAAHGAGYRVLPQVLHELGAEVVVQLGCAPDGYNINVDCGSEHPQALLAAVRDTGADLGIAIDGDGDRVVLCDQDGVIDGDGILAFLSDALDVPAVVGTQMTNGALEAYLTSRGRVLHRAPVGDRYVRACMRAEHCALGGEPSGHILLNSTGPGDGIGAALQVLSAGVQNGTIQQIGAACRPYVAHPQVMLNLSDCDALCDQYTSQAEVAARAAGASRVIIRRSGTQAMLRIMTEASDVHTATVAASTAERVLRGRE